MWFKDIAKWSQKKLRLTSLLYNALYLVLMIVIPIVIVTTKYNLRKDGSAIALAGLILMIFIVVFSFKYGKRLFNHLPQVKKEQQVFKFTVLLLINLIAPISGLFLTYIIKQNVVLALDTISYCLYSIIGGIVLDHLTIRYLEAEKDLRNKAEESLAIDERKDFLKK